YNGGGIFAGGNNTTLTVTNCTLSGNSASITGGGIYNRDALTVTNSTLSSNAASFDGGGFYNYPGSNTTLRNTIAAQNHATRSAPDIYGTVTGGSPHNLIGNGSGMTGISDHDAFGNLVGVANPGLGVLGNWGGPTQTIPLLPGSPALNAGTT